MIAYSFTLGDIRSELRVHTMRRLENSVLCLSGAGPKSSVESVAAMLRSNKPLAIAKWADGKEVSLSECPYGYSVWSTHLDFGQYHLLATSKDPRFLPAVTPDHVYAALRSDRFTTPFLRAWLPQIIDRLVRNHMLLALPGEGMPCGYLRADDDAMDKIVSNLVKRNEVVIG